MSNTVIFTFSEMDLNVTTQAFEFNLFPFLHHDAQEDYLQEFNKNWRYLNDNLNLCESVELNQKIEKGDIALELNDSQLDILRAAIITIGPYLIDPSYREQYKSLIERLMFLTSEDSEKNREKMRKSKEN